MTNITLGQYFPGNSPIHRLDPRTKILLMMLYIVVVFFVQSMTMFLLPFIFVVGVTLLSHVPVGYVLRSIRPLRILLIFMFILNLFLTPGETVLWRWWIIEIRQEALIQAIFITL